MPLQYSLWLIWLAGCACSISTTCKLKAKMCSILSILKQRQLALSLCKVPAYSMPNRPPLQNEQCALLSGHLFVLELPFWICGLITYSSSLPLCSIINFSYVHSENHRIFVQTTVFITKSMLFIQSMCCSFKVMMLFVQSGHSLYKKLTLFVQTQHCLFKIEFTCIHTTLFIQCDNVVCAKLSFFVQTQ